MKVENTPKQADHEYGSLENGRLCCHPKALLKKLVAVKIY